MRFACRFILGAMLALAAPLAWTSDLKTIEDECTFNQYYARTSAASSTHAVTGYGFSYAIKADGADVLYQVIFTTKTYPDKTVTPSSTTTSLIRLSSGTSLSADFRALTKNPNIVISQLNTAATAHVYIDYCEARK